MTQLCERVLEELQRRNHSQTTTCNYLRTVRDFLNYCNKPIDELGLDEIRQYQVHLLKERKLEPKTVCTATSALRFCFVKTLKRPYPLEEFPYPKNQRRLPIILSQDEAVALMNSAGNLFHRAMLMMAYSTGMRRAELCKVKVEEPRQQADAHPHSSRQGRQGSGCPAEPVAARYAS